LDADPPAQGVKIARRNTVSLLDRFAGDIAQKLTALLRFLGPLTGGASAVRAF
jgi:hypothetical protein